MKFNQQNVRSFSVPAGKADYILFDDDMPGFGVRVRTKGNRQHRTFVAQYKIGTKHRRITLGKVAKVSFETARKEAQKIFGKVAIGQDPANDKAEARKRASHTLDATMTAYLEAKASELRPRTHAETNRHLKTHWKRLHGLSLTSIGRANVAAQLGEIAKDSGPVAANRARASLSAMFRWAIGEGLCDENPVAGTNKREENGPRERALSDAEMTALWLACHDNDYGRIVRLLTLTGCRRDEIGSLEWSEIDLEARTITLPPHRTKNHSEHVVPLSDKALAILSEIPRRDRVHVFGVGKGGYSGWSKAKDVLGKSANLSDWTLHDLRRTVRTGLGSLGVAPHIAEAVLNHLPAKLIRTYDRNKYASEKRAALDAWAGHLAVAIAQATGANVTSLRKA